MKKEFLRAIIVLVLIGCTSITTGLAQGTYGKDAYFNFTYSKVADWSAFPAAASFKAIVDGDTLVFGNCGATGPSRVKGGYTGAVKAQSVELPKFPSLGYFSFYLQCGSSGTPRNIFIKVWNETTSAWVTVETIVVGGNADQRITVSSVLSKREVKIKIDSDGQNWIHQIEAWSSTTATLDPNEAPKILSINPVGGSTISSNGTINIQFDEMIKAGTGSVNFSSATTTAGYLGNTLKLSYSGLTNASNTLTIPGTFVQNIANVSLEKDTSITYANDITDPIFLSASPVDGSKIYVRDIVGKIILTFNEEIVLGAGTISFGPATTTSTVSGKTLIIGYSGLGYNTPYTLTVPANMVKDISGNTLKTIITLNYTTYDKDNTAPLLSSQSITNADVNVAIGGSIALTFNEIVKKAGDITLNGTPVTVSLNGSLAGINFTNLDYSTEYTVNIPAGSITDTTGNAYAGSTFKFTTKAPASKAFDIIIAKDGSGNYTTVQAAINAVPDNSTQRTFIFVTNGVYTEKVVIPATKQNLSLIGQDSAKTIITFNDGAINVGGTDNSYTIDIKATGFYAENITIKNTYGQGTQSVALMTEGDRQVFKNCRAFSFQDTHYPKTANTRSYYLNCFIEGATDFMFGSGTVFFESSTINCVSGGQYITAPSGTTREFGLVYNNCTIKANSNVGTQAFFLGRPWKDAGKTVWLNTKMGAHVKDIGWAPWATSGEDADNHLTGFFAEYNSMNLAGVSINPTRATWGVKLTSDQAARYNIDNVFNYGTGSTTWNPLPFSTAPDAPGNVAVNGNILTWSAPKYAVAYLVFRNDTMIGSTTTTTYTDVTVKSTSNLYVIKAVNEYGAQSTDPLTNSIEENNSNYKSIFDVYPNPFSDALFIKNSENVKAVEFYSIDGKLVKQTGAADSIKTTDLKAGYYMIRVTTNKDIRYTIKMVK